MAGTGAGTRRPAPVSVTFEGIPAMPQNRLDIFNQSYPGLIPLQYSKERSSDGKLQVDCKCKVCGKTKAVRPKHLSILKSCRCIMADVGRRNVKFTRKVICEEQKKNEIKIDADGRWLAARAARRFLNVAKKTILLWRESCTYLEGQGIRTRPFPRTFSEQTLTDDYYSEDDLKRIRDARTQRKPLPARAGYVHVVDAIKRLGINEAAFYQRLASIKEATDIIDGKSKIGRSTKRAYITQEAFDKLKAMPRDPRIVESADPKLVTRKQAAKILGGSIPLVDKLLRNGKLKYAQGTLILRSEVDSLAAARRNNRPTSGYLWEDPRTDEEVAASRRTPSGQREASSPADLPSDDDAAPAKEAKKSGRRKETRGRPEGRNADIERRERELLEAWDRGEFSSKAAAARAFKFHRPDVSKLIDKHLSEKA